MGAADECPIELSIADWRHEVNIKIIEFSIEIFHRIVLDGMSRCVKDHVFNMEDALETLMAHFTSYCQLDRDSLVTVVNAQTASKLRP